MAARRALVIFEGLVISDVFLGNGMYELVPEWVGLLASL